MNYFTSSEVVRAYVNIHGEPDYRLIVSTFQDGREATLEEARVLASINSADHPNFLNRTSGAGYFDAAARKRMSEAAKSRWEDATYRAEQICLIQTRAQKPERNAKLSASLKDYYSDDTNRQRISQQVKGMWQDPVMREHLVRERRERMLDPAVKAQAAANGRNAHKDPVVKERMREAARQRWADPDKRAAILESRRLARERRHDPQQ
ncbi:hypothetical protein [Brevundimonas sp.]|uniref:hypothetical protein n=1 Tax=Brevundimonas sp. TaxID=1871086 RepID=UPI0028976D19|nr:hypothetical protein [Brevundimonas sp.]